MTQTFNQTKSVNNPNGTTTKKANQKTKNNERKIKKKKIHISKIIFLLFLVKMRIKQNLKMICANQPNITI